jgi:hypothetical protein
MNLNDDKGENRTHLFCPRAFGVMTVTGMSFPGGRQAVDATVILRVPDATCRILYWQLEGCFYGSRTLTFFDRIAAAKMEGSVRAFAADR